MDIHSTFYVPSLNSKMEILLFLKCSCPNMLIYWNMPLKRGLHLLQPTKKTNGCFGQTGPNKIPK